jgi:hypothetical protein
MEYEYQDILEIHKLMTQVVEDIKHLSDSVNKLFTENGIPGTMHDWRRAFARDLESWLENYDILEIKIGHWEPIFADSSIIDDPVLAKEEPIEDTSYHNYAFNNIKQIYDEIKDNVVPPCFESNFELAKSTTETIEGQQSIDYDRFAESIYHHCQMNLIENRLLHKLNREYTAVITKLNLCKMAESRDDLQLDYTKLALTQCLYQALKMNEPYFIKNDDLSKTKETITPADSFYDTPAEQTENEPTEFVSFYDTPVEQPEQAETETADLDETVQESKSIDSCSEDTNGNSEDQGDKLYRSEGEELPSEFLLLDPVICKKKEMAYAVGPYDPSGYKDVRSRILKSKIESGAIIPVGDSNSHSATYRFKDESLLNSVNKKLSELKKYNIENIKQTKQAK